MNRTHSDPNSYLESYSFDPNASEEDTSFNNKQVVLKSFNNKQVILKSFNNNNNSRPEIIIKNPIYRRSESILNLWKSMIYDVDSEMKFNNTNHSVIISLLSWNELVKYKLHNYPYDVQKSGLIFIHVPINKKNKYISFSDINTITTMINNYMDDGHKILIHSNNSRNRALLFIAFCMINGHVNINEVLNIMNELDLQHRYYNYLRKYADYYLS